MSEIDPNKIIAATGTALTKDFLKSLSETVKAGVKKRFYQYFESFTPYLDRAYIGCSTVKTIINKEKPVSIDDIYVKASFSCGPDRVDDDALCQAARDNKRIVVTGFGGIGKTVFCKYLFLSIFRNPEGRIPVFFELRRINDLSDKNLSAYIRVSLTAEREILTDEVFRAMMADGRFVFILDGFDEIPDEFKSDIQRQILEMAHLYRACGFVVSSRFDDRFSSWQEFDVYKALPFEKTQTLEVIEKAQFDKDTKKEFITNIYEKRYEDYKGFFSTPLLILMMMMTYLQIRHIPDNVQIFYRYAFQTLFTLHDASKEGFQRKRRLNLSEQEFMEIFSIFCLSSYVDMEHTFNEERCIAYLEKAKKRVNGTFDTGDFLADAKDAVNMLFKDGDQYTFIHRSFQEYFTSYAITHYFVKPIIKVLPKIPRRESDSVFSMAHSMNPSVIDEFYILPEYERHQSNIAELLKIEEPISVLRMLDYRIRYGFEVRKSHLAPFMFSIHGANQLEVFINTVFLMFKDTAPKGLSGDDVDRHVLKTMGNVARFIKSDIKGLQDRRVIYASLNLNTMAIEIEDEVNFRQAEPPKILFSKNLVEVDWKRDFSAIVASGQRAKGRAVFIKRKIDEIRRNHRKARETSDDILSM